MCRDAPHMGAIGGVRVHFASTVEGHKGMAAAKKRRISPNIPTMPRETGCGASVKRNEREKTQRGTCDNR